MQFYTCYFFCFPLSFNNLRTLSLLENVHRNSRTPIPYKFYVPRVTTKLRRARGAWNFYLRRQLRCWVVSGAHHCLLRVWSSFNCVSPACSSRFLSNAKFTTCCPLLRRKDVSILTTALLPFSLPASWRHERSDSKSYLGSKSRVRKSLSCEYLMRKCEAVSLETFIGTKTPKLQNRDGK